MIRIYFYKGYKKEIRNNIIKEVLNDFDFDKIDDLKIKVNKNGKPYFENNDIYFSISHTTDVWCMVLSDTNVGIDIQYVVDEKKSKYKQISEKYFSDEEKYFIKQKKGIGFTKIWTLKEAYTKFLGERLIPFGINFNTFMEEELKENDYFKLKNCYAKNISYEINEVFDNRYKDKIVGHICIGKIEDKAIEYKIIHLDEE